MAEKEDEDNPFSFKSFVSAKDMKTPTSSSRIDVDDIFQTDLDLNLDLELDLESAKANPTLAKNDLHKEIPNSGSSKGASKKAKPKENPFSFKKFLSGSTSNTSNETPLSRVASSSSSANGGTHGPNSSLPGLTREKVSAHRPDASHVDLLGENRNGFSLLEGKTRTDQKDSLFIESDDENTSSGNILSGPSIPSSLPDFLSDGAALSASSIGASSMTNSTHEDLLTQIQMLQEENMQLRKDIATEKQRCSDKNQKLSQLQIDMERQKKKEAEETKVMEKAVLQVEENLVSTTQRAVQAEATVVKLKQEVKALQNQVKLLTSENQAYHSGDGGLSDLRERTKYTAEQLVSASAVAERNIKELTAGVDKLKLLSQVLSSLEKVSEVKEDQPTKKEPKVS